MEHKIDVSVSKGSEIDRVMQCRPMLLRERLLTRLLGPQRKVMVLVPGDSVSALTITEVDGGGAARG